MCVMECRSYAQPSPGTEAKVRVFADRAARGEPLHQETDESLSIDPAPFLAMLQCGPGDGTGSPSAVQPETEIKPPVCRQSPAELLKMAIEVARRAGACSRRDALLDQDECDSEAGYVVAVMVEQMERGKLVPRKGDVRGLLVWLVRRAVFGAIRRRAEQLGRMRPVGLFDDKRELPAGREDHYRDYLNESERAVAEAYIVHRSVTGAAEMTARSPVYVWRVLRKIRERISPHGKPFFIKGGAAVSNLK